MMTDDSHVRPAMMSKRWMALLCASVLLHLFGFNWAGGMMAVPDFGADPPSPITAEIRFAPTGLEPAAAVVQDVPAPAPQRKHTRPVEPATTPEIIAIAPPLALAADHPLRSQLAEVQVPWDAKSEVNPGVGTSEKNARHYKVDPPPSAELTYSVQAMRDGQVMYGNGRIEWVHDQDSYAISGQTSLSIAQLISFKSEGAFDDDGLAPLLYVEKRFRKSETNTHFHPERRTISFSASTASYPRQGGEQDRASVIWQLAGIGRADPAAIVPGAQLDVFVAGTRDAEVWHIQAEGLERIALNGATIEAWHLIHLPRPGTHEQKLDVWLAPQQEWHPVRLRFTEISGDFTELSLSQSLNPT